MNVTYSSLVDLVEESVASDSKPGALSRIPAKRAIREALDGGGDYAEVLIRTEAYADLGLPETVSRYVEEGMKTSPPPLVGFFSKRGKESARSIGTRKLYKSTNVLSVNKEGGLEVGLGWALLAFFALILSIVAGVNVGEEFGVEHGFLTGLTLFTVGFLAINCYSKVRIRDVISDLSERDELLNQLLGRQGKALHLCVAAPRGGGLQFYSARQEPPRPAVEQKYLRRVYTDIPNNRLIVLTSPTVDCNYASLNILPIGVLDLPESEEVLAP